MIQVNPGEQFPIMRVLKDHTDTGTNFVQAVIKNARTNVTMNTIDLSDQGSRIFTGVWDVPYDTTDLYYAVIITTVYTDSGFTNKSVNYAEEAEQLLVSLRWGLQFGGGGSTDISWKKMREVLREIFKEQIGGLPAPKVTVNASKPNLDPLADKIIDAFKMATETMKPDNMKPELSVLSKQITLLFKELKDTPRFEKTDLEPVYGLIKETAKAVTEGINNEISKINKSITLTIPDIEDKIALIIADKVRKHFKEEGVSITLAPPPPQEVVPTKKDRAMGLLRR